jgi:hypothetical protein
MDQFQTNPQPDPMFPVPKTALPDLARFRRKGGRPRGSLNKHYRKLEPSLMQPILDAASIREMGCQCGVAIECTAKHCMAECLKCRGRVR